MKLHEITSFHSDTVANHGVVSCCMFDVEFIILCIIFLGVNNNETVAWLNSLRIQMKTVPIHTTFSLICGLNV